MNSTLRTRAHCILWTIAIASYGCSAPDAGSPCAYSSSDVPASVGGGGAAAPSTGTTTGGSNASNGSGAGGTSATGASVADAGAPASTAFLGDPAPYASKPIAISARQRHATAGSAAQQPETNCLSCHTTGGVAVPFLAAGWVATQPNGTTGASDVEVRVWSAAAKAGASNHSDADGFYWIKAPATPLTTPYRAGIRDATHVKLMPPDAPGGGCNSTSCHGAATGPVTL